MTREEAKEFLITISYKLGNMAIEYLTEKDGKKMREAIKELEQEPCEDAISREDALMALTGEWTEPTDELIHRFIRRIRTLPSVKPQYTEDEIQKMQDLEQAEIQKAYELGKTEGQKTGHWIFIKTIFDRYGCTAECSSCHKKWKTYDEIRFAIEHDYCPKCGAKMVKPQESEVIKCR